MSRQEELRGGSAAPHHRRQPRCFWLGFLWTSPSTGVSELGGDPGPTQEVLTGEHLSSSTGAPARSPGRAVSRGEDAPPPLRWPGADKGRRTDLMPLNVLLNAAERFAQQKRLKNELILHKCDQSCRTNREKLTWSLISMNGSSSSSSSTESASP